MGIPLTVVGGYLGSGKTSAISEMLKSGFVRDLAVIVNDFGELDFDAQLLSSGAEGLVSFNNGCVCCDASDGLSAALDLLKHRNPRRVIVEASGVGDPAALAAWSTSPGFVPGGIVVCVDATTINARLRDKWVGDTVGRQIASADIVLITHADIASDAVLQGSIFVVRTWAPRAEIIVRAPGIGLAEALDMDDHPARRPSSVGTALAPHAVHESWSLAADTLIDRELFESAMRTLPAGVIRLKGFLSFTGSPNQSHSVQSVGTRFAIEAHPGLAPRLAELTVIARPGTSRTMPAFTAAGLEPTDHDHTTHTPLQAFIER